MKTFIFLFMIAASLPADAQRVRENIRQKSVISGVSQPSEKTVASKKAVLERLDAKRK